MSIKLQLPEVTDLKPRLTVIGVGGAGCNAINNMIASGLTGVDFVVANTDAQALMASSAEHRLQLGVNLTEGLGAGAKPEIGEAAAQEALDEIRSQVSGSHMVFIAAGMGGGTGTGAASVIARAAKEQGILTVGVVTKPFLFEGARRMRVAEAGIEALRPNVDTLIVIPNQNLFLIANEKTTFAEAFVLADHVLYSGVACIVDLIIKEGLINLDFADVRAVMCDMGTAMMGTGEASGERRSVVAAEEAIANPLLDDVSLQGAKGLLLSITGGPNLTLYEVDAAASRVRQEVDSDATIIVGATFDESLGDRVRVSIVASGMARMSRDGTAIADYGRSSLRPGDGSFVSEGMSRSSPPLSMGPSAAEGAGDSSHEGQRYASAETPPQINAMTDEGDAPVMSSGGGERELGGMADVADIEGDDIQSADFSTASDADDAADLQRRLAEAMQMDDAGGSVGEGDLSEGWHAPGDVVIKEEPPPFQQPAQASDPGAPFGQRQRAQVDPGSFQPMTPNDIRRHPRRMPEVGDFSPIAQKEYYSKTGNAAARGPSPERMPHHASGEGKTAKPKRGLFGLFKGLSRRKSDSQDAKQNPQTTVTRDHEQGRAEVAGNARPDDSAASHNQLGEQDDSVELPVFFNAPGRR